MPSGPTVILLLKAAVAGATLLLLAALFALLRGNYRLHGRINLVFFIATMTAVLLFEAAIRIGPYVEEGWSVTQGWTDRQLLALRIHLCFVIPLTFLLPVMLVTGWRRMARLHKSLAVVFAVLWAGMLVTGLIFLPH